jgi:uncharacterized protein (TIGR02722 family)
MRTLLLLPLFIILLGGCASKVQYGDAQAVETVDTQFGSTDLQSIANTMVDSLLQFPPVVEITRQKRPILLVDRVANKTTEHVDTQSITDSIINRLMRTGKFQFVDMTNMQAVQEQLAFQTSSGMVDPTKAIQIGRMSGAQYMLYGNLSSIVKQSQKEKDVYYKFTLRMMNLETGLLEWQDEKEIRKSMSRSVFWL